MTMCCPTRECAGFSRDSPVRYNHRCDQQGKNNTDTDLSYFELFEDAHLLESPFKLKSAFAVYSKSRTSKVRGISFLRTPLPEVSICRGAPENAVVLSWSSVPTMRPLNSMRRKTNGRPFASSADGRFITWKWR